MDSEEASTSDEIRSKIAALRNIPYLQRSESDKSALNDLQAELQSLHPECQQGWGHLRHILCSFYEIVDSGVAPLTAIEKAGK